MRRGVFSIFLFFMTGLLCAQGTLRTTSGKIHFNASTPLEDINANNEAVNAILKKENGNFASVLLIKDFSFKKKLMQEHFNENYMDSETYPKAYFSGNIEAFSWDDLPSSKSKYQAKGKLTIHGVTKEVNTEIFLRKNGKGAVMSASFIVRPEDYDIEVPKLLFKKIAQEVEVNVVFTMTE